MSVDTRMLKTCLSKLHSLCYSLITGYVYIFIHMYIYIYFICIYKIFFNHQSLHLKLVLILSLVTNNSLNIFDTSPSELAMFCNVGDPSNHTRWSLHQRKLNILHFPRIFTLFIKNYHRTVKITKNFGYIYICIYIYYIYIYIYILYIYIWGDSLLFTRNSCYSLDQSRKDERLRWLWSHPVVMNLCINLVITRYELKSQYVKLTQLWHLTVNCFRVSSQTYLASLS